jgi:cell division protein FtsI/penicillin-binding protein 2
MLRREALAALFGGVAGTAAGPNGAAILLDVGSGRLLSGSGAAAGRSLVQPGSTLKPIVLAALLQRGKLRADETYPCPGTLRIGAYSLDCSHPPIDTPMRIDSALAYSCNCFTAHMAERFTPGELAAELERAGLTASSRLFGKDEVEGRVARAEPRLQALGEEGVSITPAGLAMAYRRLALTRNIEPVIAGLEAAVEYGTAQRARVDGFRVAGKTGSVRTTAWFAGFAPSRGARVVVVVMQQGRSGGADAAPAAGRILAEWYGGRL